MNLAYHVIAALFWRAVLLSIWPLTWFGLAYETAIGVLFLIAYHDEATQ